MAYLWQSSKLAWGPVTTSQGGVANSKFDYHELTNTCSTGSSTNFFHSGSRSVISTLSNPTGYAAVRNILTGFHSNGSAALPGVGDNAHRDVWIGGYFYLPYGITVSDTSWNIFQLGGHVQPTDEIAFVVDLYNSTNPSQPRIRVTWWGGNSGSTNMPFSGSTNSYYDESQVGSNISSGVWHHLEMHIVWNTFAANPTMTYDGNVDFYLNGVAWSTNYWNNCALRNSWGAGYAAFNNYTRAYPTSGSLGDPFDIYWDDMYIADARVSSAGGLASVMDMQMGISGILTGPQLPTPGGLGGLT